MIDMILLILGGALIGLCIMPIVLLVDTLVVHIKEKKAKEEEYARYVANLEKSRDAELKKMDENLILMAEYLEVLKKNRNDL